MYEPKSIEERAFLESYDSRRYPKPSVTADIVIIAEEAYQKEGKLPSILLVRRRWFPYKDCWAVPGGFVNPDETVERGAERELEEETGVTGIKLQQLSVRSEPGRDPRGWIISIPFWARVPAHKIDPIAGDDAAEAKFFTFDHDPDGRWYINFIDDEGTEWAEYLDECENILAFDHARVLEEAFNQYLDSSPF